jgi:hypothetical protein
MKIDKRYILRVHRSDCDNQETLFLMNDGTYKWIPWEDDEYKEFYNTSDKEYYSCRNVDYRCIMKKINRMEKFKDKIGEYK